LVQKYAGICPSLFSLIDQFWACLTISFVLCHAEKPTDKIEEETTVIIVNPSQKQQQQQQQALQQ